MLLVSYMTVCVIGRLYDSLCVLSVLLSDRLHVIGRLYDSLCIIGFFWYSHTMCQLVYHSCAE